MKPSYYLIALLFGSSLAGCKDKHRIVVVTDVKLESVRTDSNQEPPPPPPPLVEGQSSPTRSSYGTFQEWLNQLCKKERPGNSIIAYNFGIFETATGYTVYLIGSRTFDSKDQDWATNKDFEPKDEYFPLPGAQYKKLAPQKVRQKIKAQLLEFTETDEFKNSFFAKAKAITTGFDDGELVRIR